MGSSATPIGTGFTVNIKLGFFFTIISVVIMGTAQVVISKSESKKALDVAQSAVERGIERDKKLEEMLERLGKLEQKQDDFQNSYEHDANKYFRDFNDRYNRIAH